MATTDPRQSSSSVKSNSMEQHSVRLPWYPLKGFWWQNACAIMAAPIVSSMSSYQLEPLNSLADEVLVERFQSTGEMTYLEDLWRRYSRTIYSKCLWFLRDASAAEDITADVFLKAIASLRAQYQPYHFAGWLFTVARHECINHVRQAAERLRGGHTDDLHLAAPGDPTIAADIESVLSRLSAPQRIAIKLFCANRYSYEEIAELEGWTLKEVKTHLQNGRRRFRLMWDRTEQRTET